MKYLVFIPFLMFVGLSFIVGVLFWLWAFNKDQFRIGFSYLNERVKFSQFMEKHFEIFKS